MTKLPRTRQASYEQGWEDGFMRGEICVIEDLKPHLQNLLRELKQGWVPASVLASMHYIKQVIDE